MTKICFSCMHLPTSGHSTPRHLKTRTQGDGPAQLWNIASPQGERTRVQCVRSEQWERVIFLSQGSHIYKWLKKGKTPKHEEYTIAHQILLSEIKGDESNNTRKNAT